MTRTPALAALLLPFALAAQPGPRFLNKADLAAAQELYAQGQLDSALVLVDRVIAKDGTLAAAFKLRGDIHQRKNNIDGALTDYAQAEDLGSSDPRLFVSRSAARITSGNLKGALRDLDRALELSPQDADIHYNRACALYLGGDNKGAQRDVERALRLKSDYAEALYLSGVIKGEEYREEAGLADIEAALRLKPDLQGGLMSQAVLLYELKRYEAAIETFTAVIAANGEGKGEAYYYRGDSHYELGHKDLACADWAISAGLGDKDAQFIQKNYCETDAIKIPKKPTRKRKRTVIQF